MAHEDSPQNTSYQIVDRHETKNEKFFTVELAPDFFVDVKAISDTGLVYVMQNGDGSTVFSNGDKRIDETWPDFEYDEGAVIQFVKETCLKIARSEDDLTPHISKAATLPVGWGWEEWIDGSGLLRSPDGIVFFDYDRNPYANQGGIEFRATTEHPYDVFWGSLSEFKDHAESAVIQNFLQKKEELEGLIQFGIEDKLLHSGEKVKILNEYFKDQVGTIHSFMWTTQEYIVTMDNGHNLPFRSSELEKCEDKKRALSDQIQSASTRAAELQFTSPPKAKEPEPDI